MLKKTCDNCYRERPVDYLTKLALEYMYDCKHIFCDTCRIKDACCNYEMGKEGCKDWKEDE